VGAQGERHDCKCYDRCLARYNLDLPPRWPSAAISNAQLASGNGLGAEEGDAATEEGDAATEEGDAAESEPATRPRLNVLVAVRGREGQLSQWLMHAKRSMEHGVQWYRR
jgi:hypothetical protein